MPGNFFGSNVLLYIVPEDDSKAKRAAALLQEGGTISVQVLNELANVLRRKFRAPWRDIHHFLTDIRALLDVRVITTDTHDLGLAMAARYGFSIYDAMIVAAALEAGSDTVLSEDMQDGLVINGRARIVNPFGGAAAPP